MSRFRISKTISDRGLSFCWKRAITVLLACALLLVSCVKAPQETSENSVVPVSFAFTVSSSANPPDYFSAEIVDLSLGIDGGYSLPISITEHEGDLAVLHRFIPEDGESYAKHYIATYDTQGNRLTLSELTGGLSEKIITGIRSGADGNLLILEPWVSETKVYRYLIPEQKVTGTVTLKLPDEYVNTENLYTDTKGQFYLTALDPGGTKVFIYDAEGKLLNSEYREGVNGAAFQLGDTFFFEASVDSSRNRILYPVDIESAAFLDIVDVSETFGNEMVFTGQEYLCSMNSQGLYWFDAATNEKQTMIFWEESGIDKRLLSKRIDISVLSRDALFLMVEDDSFEKDFYVLNRQDINPNAGKKVLVLASMLTDGDSFLEAAIQAFNDKNTEYKIVYKDYWSGIDYSLSWEEKVLEAERQIHLDLISGNGPDILCCPSRVMKESGLLEDLMPLIYADSNFSMEDYLPNLIEAAQDGDALYSFPISFGLDGLTGKASFIGEKTGWTVEEFNQMAQALPKGVVPITRFSQSDLLQEALSVPSAGFYNSDLSGESILEEEFISLLEWAKEYGVPDEIAKERRESGEEGVITNELLETDKLAVIDVDIWSVLSMEWPSSLYGHKKPLTYTGFPSPNGLGLSAILNDYAITGHCTEPKIAWTFIEFLLSEEMQSKVIYYEAGIPVRIASIELLTQFVLTPEDYPELIKPSPWESNSDPEEEKAYKEFLRDIGVPVFNELVFAVNSIKDPDEDFIKIVLEEAAAYFNDMKTAEEVTDIIKNRAQTLFNERAT